MSILRTGVGMAGVCGTAAIRKGSRPDTQRRLDQYENQKSRGAERLSYKPEKEAYAND